MTRKLFCAALALSVSAAFSQTPPPKSRKSPHEQASVSLGGSSITIDYGRPSLRGRKAVGGTLVPYGQVWRTGADEATKLTTPVDLMIGDLSVPAGSYALFTDITANGWTLVVDKKWDQWGAFTYDKGSDLGRVPMQMGKPSSPVEEFTIAFQKSDDKSATLMLSWENTTASVPVRVK